MWTGRSRTIIKGTTGWFTAEVFNKTHEWRRQCAIIYMFVQSDRYLITTTLWHTLEATIACFSDSHTEKLSQSGHTFTLHQQGQQSRYFPPPQKVWGRSQTIFTSPIWSEVTQRQVLQWLWSGGRFISNAAAYLKLQSEHRRYTQRALT